MTSKDMDMDIKREVEEQLYWDDRIDPDNVYVKVENGKVTITGEVPTYTALRAASMDATVIPGVVAVDNLLEVKRTKTEEGPGDEEIMEMVMNIFSTNPEFDITKITAAVNNGEVTIDGNVDSFWKKHWAEELAGGTRGVSKVHNRLAVVPSKDALDSTIADQINSAIIRSRSVDDDKIDIKVTNGVVEISGSVPDYHAFESINKAALYTSGVVDVHNNVSIG